MYEVRFLSALAMDQPALLADSLSPCLRAPVGERITLDLTDLQRVSAFGLAALGARMMWMIRTKRMPSGSTIRRPASNRVGNDLLRMGLYRLIQEGSDQVYRALDPVARPQELWLVERLEDLAVASQRLCQLLRLVVPAPEETYIKLDSMIQALGVNVFTHADTNCGAVICAQAFPKSAAVEFAVADAGIGIRAGLARADFRAEGLADDGQALQAAMAATFTGRASTLPALAGTAKINKGEMTVLSGGAYWAYRAGQASLGTCKPFPGTVAGMKLVLMTGEMAEESQLQSLLNAIGPTTFGDMKIAKSKPGLGAPDAGA